MRASSALGEELTKKNSYGRAYEDEVPVGTPADDLAYVPTNNPPNFELTKVAVVGFSKSKSQLTEHSYILNDSNVRDIKFGTNIPALLHSEAERNMVRSRALQREQRTHWLTPTVVKTILLSLREASHQPYLPKVTANLIQIQYDARLYCHSKSPKYPRDLDRSPNVTISHTPFKRAGYACHLEASRCIWSVKANHIPHAGHLLCSLLYKDEETLLARVTDDGNVQRNTPLSRQCAEYMPFLFHSKEQDIRLDLTCYLGRRAIYARAKTRICTTHALSNYLWGLPHGQLRFPTIMSWFRPVPHSACFSGRRTSAATDTTTFSLPGSYEELRDDFPPRASRGCTRLATIVYTYLIVLCRSLFSSLHLDRPGDLDQAQVPERLPFRRTWVFGYRRVIDANVGRLAAISVDRSRITSVLRTRMLSSNRSAIPPPICRLTELEDEHATRRV
ncbi:hypothetical protein BDY19DRAFT_906912 [Irpex rosettiformis]|uniref:Uncharacterized protein n=1 Tax=Irpex rosettiformis TaxID=378272 RepID=A0ACB8U2L6_9APHY|nr:hypothetical protein BDY19DRAFT_906912 [Irpex rosettiformis]